MFEKIKAWIKRKRETAREQQEADRLIKHIEQALGFELYEWQRLYIYNNWDMAAARGTATRKNDSIYIAAIIRPE